MNIINNYTKSGKKVSYSWLFRLAMLFNATLTTFWVRLRRNKLINPRIKKVFIETISFCNNDCGFCPASLARSSKNPAHKMTEQTFGKIVSELRRIRFKGTLALYCNNEPLLDPRMPNFIKALRREFPQNNIEITTNGIKLTASLAQDLFDCGLSSLIVNHYDDALRLSSPLAAFVKDFSKSPHNSKVAIYLRLKNEVLSNRAGRAQNSKLLNKPLKLWCSLPFEQLYFNYAGDCILCCSDVLWETAQQNINQSSIEQIWQGKLFHDARKALLRGDRDKVSVCSRCDFIGISHNPKAFLKTMVSVLR